MAISLVQFATPAVPISGNSASARTISLPSPVGYGNTLVLGVSGYYNQGSAAKDQANNSFILGSRAATGPWAELWYQPSAAGGPTTITFTPSGGAWISLFLAEFSGVATVGQPCATASRIGGGTPVTTTTTGSFTSTPSAGDLIVSMLALGGNTTGSITWPGGDMAIGTLATTAGGEPGAMGCMLSDGTNTARTGSWSTASPYPAMVGLVLKPAAISGAPGIGPGMIRAGSSSGRFGAPEIGSPMITFLPMSEG